MLTSILIIFALQGVSAFDTVSENVKAASERFACAGYLEAGKFHFFGGVGADGSLVPDGSSVVSFDPGATDQFSTSSLPVPVRSYARIIEMLGYIFVIGGSRTGTLSGYYNYIDTVSPSGQVSVGSVDPALYGYLVGHNAISIGKQIYIYGTDGGNGVILQFTPSEGKISKIEVEGSARPRARIGMGMVADGNGFIIFGGGISLNGPATSELWRFDLESLSWNQLATAPASMIMPATFKHLDVIYFYGGISNDQPVDDVLAYDKAQNSWSTAQNAPFPQPVGLSCSAQDANNWYIYGGNYFGGRAVSGSLRHFGFTSKAPQEFRSEKGRELPSGVWIGLTIIILVLLMMTLCMSVLTVRRYRRINKIRARRRAGKSQQPPSKERNSSRPATNRAVAPPTEKKMAMPKLHLPPDEVLPSFMDELTMIAQDLAGMPTRISERFQGSRKQTLTTSDFPSNSVLDIAEGEEAELEGESEEESM